MAGDGPEAVPATSAASALRSPPTASALAWATAAVRRRVVDVEVMRGGTTSAMYRLRLSDSHQIVLRCYVLADVLERDPGLPAREAAGLEAAEQVDLPTPTLLAVETTGAAAGVPSLMMSHLPGQVVWDPRNTRSWLERLSEVLPAIHHAEPPSAADEYRNYQQDDYTPPAWAEDRRIWERAIELFLGSVLETDRCFIHRDFHPGNVLWVRGRVTGVVDWQSACNGPPSADIGHCRANFLLYDPPLAEQFTIAAERALGHAFHPWADIAALIGMLDGLRRRPPNGRARNAIETTLARAAAAIQ